MSIDHEPGKARQLETASSSGAVLESDEALARRLHEELNALTRHSRRGPAAAGQPQQLQLSRSEKLPDSKAAAAGHTKPVSKQQRVQSDAEAQLGSMQQRDGSDKQQPGRKRSILNRELAMLVTDMVDSQLKPATGPRQTKSKDEQVADQHKGSSELLASVEQLLPILKHESSSSQSEQERLALEHVQAAVADGTPQAKQAQQRQQHFAARASDSGADLAAGDSGCISGAESSGRDSSNSSGERDHGQQHTSPAAADQSTEQQQQQPPRGRHAQQQQAAPAQATGKGKQQQQDAAAGGGSTVKMIKIPKLPMVEYAKKWYRAKVLKDTGPKVLLEYQGYSHEGGPFWLPKDHARIWRGSYKGRDWKYLGDGAWEPKTSNKSGEGKVRRAKTHRSSSAAAAAATAAGDGGVAADSDTEQLVGRQQRRGQVQQQQHRQKKQKQPQRRGAAAAAAGSLKQEGEGGRADGGAVSERDTTSADQQGEAAGDADAAGPSAAEQGEVDSGMQLDEPCKREEEAGEEQQQLDEQACGADLTGAAAMETDQQQDRQAELGQQQQQPGAAADAVQGEDCKQQLLQLQADEQPDMLLGAEQCNKVALIRSASSRAAEAAAEAAAAAAAASVKQETVDAAEAAAAMAPAHAAALAAAVQAQPAAESAKRSSLPGTSPLLMGHTHEEMVAAAAAAVAVAAPPAPRGRGARSGRSNSARSNGDGISEGTSRRGRGGRGGRGRGAAAAARAAAAAAAAADAAAADAAAFQEQEANHDMLQQQQQFQQAQQPAASGSASGSGQLPGNLRVEPGRALKHSGSSEGPLSPTSPSGGSPKANSRRRKGVPRRARLDSEDLQRPTKRVRGAPKPSAYCETAMEWQQHEQQVQRQHMLEQQRQAAQLAAQQQQAAWKAAGRGGGGYGAGSSASSAKKSMWQTQQPGEFAVSAREQARQQQAYWQQEQQQQQVWAQALPSPRQQTLAAAAAAAAAAECQAAVAEHQQALLLQQTQMQGSEPEDVEAACVLLGAAMGRAHSGEVATGLVDSQAAGYTQHGLSAAAAAQRSFSLTAADESMQLSPRFAGVGRQGAKRRGHNWSKQLSSNTSRPPRPPAPGQQQGPSSTAGFRHSLNGSSSLPQPQRRISFSNAELGMDGVEQQQQQHSYGGLLKGRNGSCAGSNGKADTLRTLLDAVGQVQSSSGRPDLMFPMQFGGVPMGTQAPGKNGRNGAVQPLQLLHTPVSAAAATLLAAVPSLDAVQRMAVLQGQGGVLACLTGEPPSLFL